MIDLGRGCSRYGAVLVEFVDHGEVGPHTPAALRHLDGCHRCTEAVEATLLTITALRRLADEIQDAEPRPDAWPRLRARIASFGRRPVVMSPLAGVAMSVAIVAVLVLPFHVGIGPGSAEAGTTFDAGTGAVVDRSAAVREHRVETAYLASSRRVDSAGSAVESGSVPLFVPAEVREIRKEVHSAKPSGRPPDPI